MVRETLRRWLVGAVDPEVERLREEVSVLSLRLASARQSRKPMSGVAFTGGPEGGSFEYETNAQLRGTAKWDTLRKMESDAHVAGALRSIVLPLQSAEWQIQAASDKAKDIEIQEFVAANLLRQPSEKFGREYWSKTPWKAQRLPEILDFLIPGYSMFAKTWTAVEGKGGMRQVYDRLVWLEPSSVDPRGWVLDGDRLIAVKRTFRQPDGTFKLQEPISADEIALYVWNLKGARLEGSPFIRAMYGSWFRKDWLLRQSMIWAQKVGAPAPWGSFPSGWGAAEKTAFITFLQQLRGTAPVDAWGAFPMSSDGQEAAIHFADTEKGEVDRLRGLIDGENAEIAHAGGTKSQLAGETTSGSRAVAGTQQSFEMLLVQAVADVVCEFENFGASTLTGVIEDLVNRNYQGVNAYPQLAVSKIEPHEDLVTIERLIQAKQAGLVPDHPELRRQVTERLGYTLPDDAYEVPDEPVAEDKPRPDADTVPDKDEEASEDADVDVSASAVGRKFAARLALRDLLSRPALTTDKVESRASGYGRAPTEFESTVLVLGQIVTAFNVSQAGIAAVLKSSWRSMLEDVVARGRAGKISQGTLDGLRRSRPKGEQGMKARAREQFLATAMRGQQHADEELARQRELAKKDRRALLEALPKAAVPPRGTRPPAAALTAQVIYDELANEAMVTASISVDDLWARMVSEAVAEYQRLYRQGLTDDALWSSLESYLSDLSSAPVDRGARHMSAVAYNEGRDLSGKTAAIAGRATWALRSEVLDQNTCERCASLDGMMATIGSAEYDQLMPPAQCLGAENCRGVIVILDAELTDRMAEES